MTVAGGVGCGDRRGPPGGGRRRSPASFAVKFVARRSEQSVSIMPFPMAVATTVAGRPGARPRAAPGPR